MFPFYHTFNAILAGPSQSGKTQLVLKLIENRDVMFSPPFSEIHWYYGEWQPFFGNLKSIVTFKEGLPDLTAYSGGKPCLLIIDDLMTENKGQIGSLFTKGTHHRNLSVIFITQNLFHQSKDSRDISLNAHYIILMKSPRDKQQLGTIARQMFPEAWRFVVDAYRDATSNPFGYLLLDMNQRCPENHRVRTGIFPDETCVVYIPRV